jgi:(R,R)-butanediol dehydrogenase/meso-butanediol dehydrogenase/diacetyl reductase
MKAARWHAARDVRVETVPDPSPAAHDVVLRVEWCGICGTDVEEYLSGPHWVPVGTAHPLTGGRAPLVMGHEFAGEVVAVGPDVRGLRIGDRVAPDTLITCGACYWCRRHQVQLCEKLAALGLMADGGLAEYCVAPEEMCIRLPESLPSDHAALAETLAVGIHALRRGRLLAGETVAIAGAGAVGLCALQAAVHGGARRVVAIEPDPRRRNLSVELGAYAAVDPRSGTWLDEVRDALGGPGPDVTIECAGKVESAYGAMAVARRGGRIVLVGLPAQRGSVDFAALAGSELELIGSLSHVYDEDFAAAVDMLASGRVSVAPLITHRLSLDDVVACGFETLAGGERSAIKILVTPQLETAREGV